NVVLTVKRLRLIMNETQHFLGHQLGIFRAPVVEAPKRKGRYNHVLAAEAEEILDEIPVAWEQVFALRGKVINAARIICHAVLFQDVRRAGPADCKHASQALRVTFAYAVRESEIAHSCSSVPLLPFSTITVLGASNLRASSRFEANLSFQFSARCRD